MAADWTRTEFDAAIDELRGSAVPDLEPTPAEWRRGLREDTEVEVFRAQIAPFSAPFSPLRSPSGRWEQQDITRHLHDLGTAVLGQWDRTGDRRALRMAIALWRDAVSRSWLTDFVSAIGALAARLLDRYHATAAVPLLDAAVYLGRDAVLTGDQAVLDDSVHAEVVAPSRQPPPDRPLAQAFTLTDMAAAQLADYLRTGDSPRLDGAIEALRAALTSTPADHRDRPLRLARLGGALCHAYRRRLEVSIVEDSVAAYRAALALPIDRLAVRTAVLVGLALALRAQYGAEDGQPEHLAEARLLAGELSAQYPPGHPDRADILAELAELVHPTLAQNDPERAERLVELLPELVSDLERRDDQEYQPLPFAGLASNAAACALRRGADPAEALDLLERGRCVLFSHTLGEGPVRVDDVVRSRVATDGPVVVVNVSRFGSHALTLTADGIRVIPLPALTPTAVGVSAASRWTSRTTCCVTRAPGRTCSGPPAGT